MVRYKKSVAMEEVKTAESAQVFFDNKVRRDTPNTSRALTISLMEQYASQQTASLREALEKIKNISRETGRDGCTYGDTDFDSQSACYGYNLCREYVQDIAIEALETQLSTTNGKQG